MTRQFIDGGGWFDVDKATRYEEGSRWDGSNHISLHTGSQWDHETLYRSAKGKWILNRWSQYQGSGESWDLISSTAAARWLLRAGEKIPAELAEIVDGLET